MNKTDNKPITLRNTLVVALLLLAAAISFGFYYTQKQLEITALDIKASVSNSNQNLDNSKSAGNLSTELAQKKKAVTVSEKFYYPATSYQTDVVVSLNKYANDAGIKITDYAYEAQSILLTIENPASYNGLIMFIGNIEQSLPKLQISGLSLSRVNGSADMVKTEKIKIEISVK